MGRSRAGKRPRGRPSGCECCLQVPTCTSKAPLIYSPAMNLRDQLLDAAVRVYAEVGYRGATTRRIAQEAGVNEITLFRHFGSKDTLLHEAIARAACGVPLGTLPHQAVDPAAE